MKDLCLDSFIFACVFGTPNGVPAPFGKRVSVPVLKIS